MGKNRTAIHFHGMGNLQTRLIAPTVDEDFANVGFIKDSKLSNLHTMDEAIDEGGRYIDTDSIGEKMAIETALMQTSLTELNLLRNTREQYHAVRYFGQVKGTGRYQYICIDKSRIIPGIDQDYKPGLRLLPARIVGLHDLEQGFTVPFYHLIETNKPMNVEGLQIWFSRQQGLNRSEVKVIDASGYGRHGTLSSDFASIWVLDGTEYILRLDGVNDKDTIGNYCDLDATKDFFFEIWVRIKGADASLQEIYAKKSDDTHTAGFRLVRKADNKLEFKLSDGAASALVPTASSLLINTWKLVQVYGNRNGNAQMMLNGVADGAAVSISAINTATNGLSLIVGQLGAGYGQIDVGDYRFHRYAADGLPSNIEAIALNHFNAQKAAYGL